MKIRSVNEYKRRGVEAKMSYTSSTTHLPIYSSTHLLTNPLTHLLCFIVLPLHLMTYVTGVADANSAAVSETVPLTIPSEITSLADDQSAELAMQQLYREEITPPQDQKESQGKTELMQLISRIHSIRFSSEDHISDNTAIKKEKPTVDPNTKPSGDSQQKPAVESKAEVSVTQTGGSVTGQTLQTLTGLLKEPQKLNNPAQLAEVLYLDGKPQQAAALYQEALRLTRPDDASQTANRAWYLFQAANCLRDSDIAAASKLFEQLIKEYPDSPWTESARTQNKIILWYQQDNPDKLVAANRQKITSPDKDSLTSYNSTANRDNDPNGKN